MDDARLCLALQLTGRINTRHAKMNQGWEQKGSWGRERKGQIQT